MSDVNEHSAATDCYAALRTLATGFAFVTTRIGVHAEGYQRNVDEDVRLVCVALLDLERRIRDIEQEGYIAMGDDL